MLQANAVHSQADAHRHDLAAAAGSHRVSRRAARAEKTRTTQRSATGLPVTGGRAVRHATTARVGAWLIDFGTRLGGTAVRPS
jgi:hypothetical protein